MTPATECRLLQLAMGFACLVPLSMGLASIIEGPTILRGVVEPVARDLDSHFLYLSGLLLGIGIALALCIPHIVERGPVFRTLGAIVVVGGAARLLSLIATGTPSGGHIFGLIMELGVVPSLMAWQWRVERRSLTANRSTH